MNVANEKDLKMTNDKKNYGNAIAHEPTMSKPNETVDGNESIECRYGWIVVGASFTIHMIADGIVNSMGLFQERISDVFKETETVTSWVSSISSGMGLCAGPIASLLVKKYGCRAVTIAGSVLATVSLFVSYFAKNVPILIGTVGFGFGTALSLVFVPAIVMVTTYFDKNRSLATGIAVSGTGVGTVGLSLLINLFIKTFDWDKTCLILSGIVLIGFTTCGILFKPLNASSPLVDITELSDKYQRDETNGVELRNKSNNFKLNLRTSTELEDRKSKKLNRESLPLKVRKSKDNQANMRSSLSQPTINTDTKMPEVHQKEWKSGIIPSSGNNNGTAAEPKVYYQGSQCSLSTQKTQSEAAIELDKYGSLRRNNDNDEKIASNNYCGCISVDKIKGTIALMNFGLLKDPIFVVFVFSNFCTSIAFYIPIFCIPKHIPTYTGNKSDGANILSIFGGVNVLGRIIVGFISDKSFVNRLWLFNFSLVICGLASAAVVACKKFAEFAICFTVLGLSISAYITLRSVILVDLFGLEKLESSFGLLLLFEGIATFIGPPIAGVLYDKFGTYDPGFWFAGIMFVISGLVLFVLPTLQKHIEKRQLRCGVDHIENVIAT